MYTELESTNNLTQLTQILKLQNNPIQSNFNIENLTNAYCTQIENKQDVYLIVRSLKNREGVQKGYSLCYLFYQFSNWRYHQAWKNLIFNIRNQNISIIIFHDFDMDINKVYEVTENLTGQCKICLIEEEYQDNFFVAPCKCKGSCEIVHINCLKKWIESKIKVKQHMIAISYNFTKFQCQICKDPYPKMIMI